MWADEMGQPTLCAVVDALPDRAWTTCTPGCQADAGDLGAAEETGQGDRRGLRPVRGQPGVEGLPRFGRTSRRCCRPGRAHPRGSPVRALTAPFDGQGASTRLGASPLARKWGPTRERAHGAAVSIYWHNGLFIEPGAHRHRKKGKRKRAYNMTTSRALPVPADTSLLGAHVRDGGALFGLWAPRATRVELALVAEDRSQTNHDMQLGDDGVWTVHVPGIGPEQRYGYRVHGEWNPAAGARLTRPSAARPVRARSPVASTTTARSWITRPRVRLRPRPHRHLGRGSAECGRTPTRRRPRRSPGPGRWPIA